MVRQLRMVDRLIKTLVQGGPIPCTIKLQLASWYQQGRRMERLEAYELLPRDVHICAISVLIRVLDMF